MKLIIICLPNMLEIIELVCLLNVVAYVLLYEFGDGVANDVGIIVYK